MVALVLFLLAVQSSAGASASGSTFEERIEHRYADSAGVRIHYARLASSAGGESQPLVVLIHGFPDFWYGWRHQMESLAEDYTVAAMDTRGYRRP